MQVAFIIILSYLLMTPSFFFYVFLFHFLSLYLLAIVRFTSCLYSHLVCFFLFRFPPIFIIFVLHSRERNWRTEKEPTLYRLNLFACQTRIIKWRQALLRSPKAFLLLCKTFFFLSHKKAGKNFIFFVFFFIFKKQNKKKLPSLYSVFRSCLIYFFTLKYSFIFV